MEMRSRAVFLDRDGTVNREVGFLDRMDRLELLPGTGQALRALQSAGFRLVVVTNQSGIARGYYSERRLKRIHGRLRKLLRSYRVRLDAVLYCPWYPGPARLRRYRRESPLRKPAPGMLLQAALRLQLDLRHSWMVGDRISDIAAGAAAGCRTVLVRSGYGMTALQQQAEWPVTPDYIVDDLAAAAELILLHGGGAA